MGALRYALSMLLLIAVAGCDTAPPPSDPGTDWTSDSTGVLRILPLGDSITSGQTGLQSYRYPLWKLLVDDGMAFDMVGTMDDVYEGGTAFPDYRGVPFDPDHEGHWGWRSAAVADAVDDWIWTYEFEVVLLHLGTNDCRYAEIPIDDVAANLARIISSLFDRNPDAAIFLAQIIPINDDALNLRASSLNEAIRGLPDAFPGQRLFLVDQNTGFLTDEYLSDRMHPNAEGEMWMAERWYESMKSAVPDVWADTGDEAEAERETEE